MRLPTIAPLTRREAAAARSVHAATVQARTRLREDAESVAFVDATIVSLTLALAEYDSRSMLGKCFPPAAEHRVRLRTWLEEISGAVAADIEERFGR